MKAIDVTDVQDELNISDSDDVSYDAMAGNGNSSRMGDGPFDKGKSGKLTAVSSRAKKNHSTAYT